MPSSVIAYRAVAQDHGIPRCGAVVTVYKRRDPLRKSDLFEVVRVPASGSTERIWVYSLTLAVLLADEWAQRNVILPYTR